MKKILSILLCSFMLLSCTDFLDQNAEDINTLEKVFSNKMMQKNGLPDSIVRQVIKLISVDIL